MFPKKEEYDDVGPVPGQLPDGAQEGLSDPGCRGGSAGAGRGQGKGGSHTEHGQQETQQGGNEPDHVEKRNLKRNKIVRFSFIVLFTRMTHLV